MFDAKGDALYVGKARSLKKRVTAYTKLTGHTNRIQRMISATTSMEFISTQTETEALLLEFSAPLLRRASAENTDAALRLLRELEPPLPAARSRATAMAR